MTDVTDNFNRANGALGTNWSVGPSFAAPTIISNQCNGGGSGAWYIAYWASASNTFSNDQHAQVVATSGFSGVIVRHQASTSSGYLAFVNPGTGQILLYRIDSSAFTLLDTIPASAVAGDTIKLDVTGSTLTCFKNGVAQGSPKTDTTYTSGQPGIAVNDTAIGDDWLGGPATVSASASVGTSQGIGAAASASPLSSIGVANGVGAAAAVPHSTLSAAIGSASGVGMALAAGAGGATLPDGVPAVATGRRLLGRKKHTAGARLRYTVDYSDWLETGERITGVAVVSSSQTTSVDAVSNQPTQVQFFLDGGLVGEETLVSLTVTDSIGQIKLDAAQFLVVPL